MMKIAGYKLAPGDVEPSWNTGLGAPRCGVSAHPINNPRNIYLDVEAPPLVVNTMFKHPVSRPLPCKPSPDLYWKPNRPPIVASARGMVPAQGLTKAQGPGLATIGRTDYPILKQAGVYANVNSPF